MQRVRGFSYIAILAGIWQITGYAASIGAVTTAGPSRVVLTLAAGFMLGFTVVFMHRLGIMLAAACAKLDLMQMRVMNLQHLWLQAATAKEPHVEDQLLRFEQALDEMFDWNI